MSQGNGWMLRKRILATAIAGVILGGSASYAQLSWDGGASPNNNWMPQTTGTPTESRFFRSN